jgi:hypothetical protein
MTDDIRAAAREALAEKKTQIMGGDAPEVPETFETPILQEVEDVQEQPEFQAEEEPILETGEAEQEAKPEGYLSYDEYIEQGGDPRYYRGEAAYADQKGMISEIKELRGALSEQKEALFAMTKFQEEQREAEQEKLLRERAYLEQQLQSARTNLDIDKYDAVRNRIDQIDSKTKQAEQPQAQEGEHPVFRNARESDPRLNHSHPDFDIDFNAQVEARVNNSIQQAQARNGGRPLTDNELASHLNAALDAVGKKAKPKVNRVAENPKPRAATPKNEKVPP